jgi:hypothetical protein
VGFQPLGQRKYRRSRVKHDCVTIFDVAMGRGSNCTLFPTVLLGALQKRSIKATPMGKYRTAECTL